ncbi:hypothetical protein A2U01_0049988, partial [Trifolium medium]|nr:hypothetical protein [Trifolium medium]
APPSNTVCTTVSITITLLPPQFRTPF